MCFHTEVSYLQNICKFALTQRHTVALEIFVIFVFIPYQSKDKLTSQHKIYLAFYRITYTYIYKNIYIFYQLLSLIYQV